MSTLNEAVAALQTAMTEVGLTSLTVTAAERSAVPRAMTIPIHEAVKQALREHGAQTVHELHPLVSSIRGVSPEGVSVRVAVAKLVNTGEVVKTGEKRRPQGIVTPTGRRPGLALLYRLNPDHPVNR